jgi:hypothetical protein
VRSTKGQWQNNGAGCWTLTKDIAKRLAKFERKVLRRIWGGKKVNEN